ncbi:hypothetical protein PV327_000342 [Microctonus hyperodae]|uniref:V-SNARE coiled-coil homology domain-containing protein n=1 Tax=Microctonus hyperodae TaxID=165561 RepID=A0AA39G6W3_MICHY|nr:hypothetical protein PV327_000342 [Microctonus hyperodae]
MEMEILCGVVIYWDTTGYKIIVCHPTENSSAYIDIIIGTIMDLTTLEVEKISVTRNQYTIHLLIGELHYACVTRSEGSPIEASCISFYAQEFLERVRCIYRELPMLIDLSRDIKQFSSINLSIPLEKMMQGKNFQDSKTLPLIKGELTEVRKVLLDSVQKLVDRGEKLDELVKKTQTLEITIRKDFRFPSRLSKKKKSICLIVFTLIIMLLSSLAFGILVYVQII